MRIFHIVVVGSLLWIGGCAGYQSAPADTPIAEDFHIVAHRAVHNHWIPDSYDPVTGCEARHIASFRNSYIENTIPSIRAAFAYGATIVEIDIRRTADNHLVVFHDDDLSCRTDGTGLVNERTRAYLQRLDVGYGYTADGGETFPLRGTGVGMIPSLQEVLEAFPNQRFLIDDKSWNMESARLLVERVQGLPEEQQRRLFYWGSDESYAYVQERTPLRRLFVTRPEAKQWALRELATLGMAEPREPLSGMVMAAPPGMTRVVWWSIPRAARRAHRDGLAFYLMLEDPERSRRLARHGIDGIVTDSIDLIGPALRSSGTAGLSAP